MYDTFTFETLPSCTATTIASYKLIKGFSIYLTLRARNLKNCDFVQHILLLSEIQTRGTVTAMKLGILRRRQKS